MLTFVFAFSKDVREEALAWYQAAKSADWDSFGAVRENFPDADLVNSLLVFNIRRNRYRLKTLIKPPAIPRIPRDILLVASPDRFL
jgi:mRNA-degrading endonuclease HigB of HigAB toxin-antitoxin module